MHDPRERIRVESYAGYRGEERPRRLLLDGRAVEVAEVLRTALEKAESQGPGDRRERRSRSALDLADLWVAFVDARDGYRRASEATPADAEEVELACLEMLSAYRRWSEG